MSQWSSEGPDKTKMFRKQTLASILFHDSGEEGFFFSVFLSC